MVQKADGETGMIHNPENRHPYDTLWAILSLDSSGNEGICAIETPIGGAQLCVTGSRHVLDIFLTEIRKPSARAEAAEAGKQIVVAEYSRTGTKSIDGN